MIVTENHGPLIVSSTFWGSEYDKAGKFFVSVNAGAIRLLVPTIHRAAIQEMRTAKHVVLSRGPWPEVGVDEAVELMFDDGTDDPFCLHLTKESFESLPADGQGWVLTAWDLKKNRPHKSLERMCYWRRVDKLPCLKPWRK